MSLIKKGSKLLEIDLANESESYISNDSISRISEENINHNAGQYSGIYNMDDFLQFEGKKVEKKREEEEGEISKIIFDSVKDFATVSVNDYNESSVN